MKLISFSAGIFFLTAVSALAGYDHYNTDQASPPPVAVDPTHTSSIIESFGIGATKTRPTVRKPVANDDESRRFWGR